MWDVGGDEFDSLETTNVGRLEIDNLFLDEPQLESVLFDIDDDEDEDDIEINDVEVD